MQNRHLIIAAVASAFLLGPAVTVEAQKKGQGNGRPSAPAHQAPQSEQSPSNAETPPRPSAPTEPRSRRDRTHEVWSEHPRSGDGSSRRYVIERRWPAAPEGRRSRDAGHVHHLDDSPVPHPSPSENVRRGNPNDLTGRDRAFDVQRLNEERKLQQRLDAAEHLREVGRRNANPQLFETADKMERHARDQHRQRLRQLEAWSRDEPPVETLPTAVQPSKDAPSRSRDRLGRDSDRRLPEAPQPRQRSHSHDHSHSHAPSDEAPHVHP